MIHTSLYRMARVSINLNTATRTIRYKPSPVMQTRICHSSSNNFHICSTGMGARRARSIHLASCNLTLGILGRLCQQMAFNRTSTLIPIILRSRVSVGMSPWQCRSAATTNARRTTVWRQSFVAFHPSKKLQYTSANTFTPKLTYLTILSTHMLPTSTGIRGMFTEYKLQKLQYTSANAFTPKPTCLAILSTRVLPTLTGIRGMFTE